MTGFIIGFVIFTVVVCGAMIYLVLKSNGTIGKKNKQVKNPTGTAAKRDVKSFRDSREFVDFFEDVRDGVIKTDDGRRFVAAINCRGCDFYHETTRQQMSIMQGYQSFIGTNEEPYTYRIHSTAMDIEHTKKMYEDSLREAEELLRVLESNFSIAQSRGADDTELAEKNRELQIAKRKYEHLVQQMQALSYYSDADTVRELTQAYIFDWNYNPSDYSVELTDDEVYDKAVRALNDICSAKASTLRFAGVKARKCTTNQVLDMNRKLSKPYGAERFRMRDLEQTAMDEDIVTSSSLEDIMAAYSAELELY